MVTSMNAELLEARIAESRQRLKELQEELDGLERACFDVSRDEGTFADQLARKRALASKASDLGNSLAALGFGAMMAERLDSSFQSSVGSCFEGMRGQLKQACDQVRAEMEEERRRISVLQEDLSAERERARIAAEREREERRKAAEGGGL